MTILFKSINLEKLRDIKVKPVKKDWFKINFDNLRVNQSIKKLSLKK